MRRRPAAAKVALVERVAVGRVPGETLLAGLAVGEREEDLVAFRDVGYLASCLEDYARACFFLLVSVLFCCPKGEGWNL